jgi:hypothetical protein
MVIAFEKQKSRYAVTHRCLPDTEPLLATELDLIGGDGAPEPLERRVDYLMQIKESLINPFDGYIS